MESSGTHNIVGKINCTLIGRDGNVKLFSVRHKQIIWRIRSIGILFEVQTIDDQAQFNEHKTSDNHIQYIEL